MKKFEFNRRVVYGLSLLFVLGTFQNCGAPKSDHMLGYSSTSQIGAAGSPTSPSQLLAVSKSSQQIDLTWRDNSNNEVGFRIERSAPGAGPFASAFTIIHTSSTDETSYSDVNLLANTQYTYRVSAINAMGASVATANAIATTSGAATGIPLAPTLLTATTTTTIVQLNWSDNSNNENYFKVERSTNGTTFTVIATTSPDVHTYQDTNLDPATTYIYRVCATNSVGSSVYTANTSVTTAAAVNVNTFTYVNANIIGPNCVACHGGGVVSGGVNLSGYAAVNANRTVMLDSIVKNRMPPGAPLSATQKTQITNWVNSGALNN